jgi:metal-sulfur cluster biosynthetic enzyme
MSELNYDYDDIKERTIAYLKTIYDPEIPTNIYDLGLIYDIKYEFKERALYCYITMTLTSAACPASEGIASSVRGSEGAIDEIDFTEVEIVFDPPWTQDKMSEEARLEMGML